MKNPNTFPEHRLKDLVRVYELFSEGDSEHHLRIFKNMSEEELQSSLRTATEFYQKDNKKIEREIDEQKAKIEEERKIVDEL